ncbi:MAG: sortase [Candidatus Paceibacterota bacterium]
MSSKKPSKQKFRGLKPFLPLVALLVFYAVIALFWNNISWIVNGNVWRQQLSDFFPQLFPKSYVVAVKSPVIISGTPKIDNKLEIKGLATTTIQTTKKSRRDLITIPKINITAPIITAQTTDSNAIHSLLDSGVVLYPGSVGFGKTGQTVILGHSAPEGWPKIKYDWVFSKLEQLEIGDLVVVTYNYETRYYKVAASQVVTPQEGVPAPTVIGNSLMLVTCWPPGKDLKRLAVEATIINN